MKNRVRPLTRLILITSILLVSLIASIPHLSVKATTWSSATQVPLNTPSDFRPSTTEDNLSRIWLVYQSSNGVQTESYYVTYNFIAWTAPILITSDHNTNESPSIHSLSNGTLFLAWVSNRTGNMDIWVKTNTNGIWSREFQLTASTATDTAPAVTQDLNGKIWVFWAREVVGNSQIYDRVYTLGVGWGSETPLTTEPNPIDITPSATVTTDGRVWMAWSSHRTGNYETWIKNFNGAIWSSDTQVTFNNNADDTAPSLAQTRDGTLWLAWYREFPINRTYSNLDIYYKNSTDVGKTWGADTAITNSLNFLDLDPSLLPATNDRLYIFWTSDTPAGTNFGIWYETSNAILIHSFAVTSVQTNQQKLFPGGFKLVNQSATVAMNATITNVGDFPETATASFYANSTLISSATVTLGRTQSATLFTKWNTTASLKPGYYQVNVIVTVPGEVLTGNSSPAGGHVCLLPLGDVDLDGYLSFIDASTVALAFQSRPGDPHWNVYADMDQDNFVSFLDVSTMAINFGIRIPNC